MPRKCRARSTTPSSLTPRLTTALTLTGQAGLRAASIPSSTRATGKSTSFIARKVASSSESRLTLTRSQAGVRAARCALRASSEPFVVSVRSRPSIAASRATSALELAAERAARRP